MDISLFLFDFYCYSTKLKWYYYDLSLTQILLQGGIYRKSFHFYLLFLHVIIKSRLSNIVAGIIS